VLSDSGTISEEIGNDGFPAVSYPNQHRKTRSTNRCAFFFGTICLLGGISTESMLQSIPIAQELHESGQHTFLWNIKVTNCSTDNRAIRAITSIVNKALPGINNEGKY